MAVVNQLLEHDTLESSDLDDIIAALNPEDHPGFGEQTIRILHQAGQVAHDAVEKVGNVVVKTGRSVRRPRTKKVDASNVAPANKPTQPPQPPKPPTADVNLEKKVGLIPKPRRRKNDARKELA
jgi:hypothetical protein